MKAGWFFRRPRTFGAHALALTPERKLILVKLRYASGWRLPGGGRGGGRGSARGGAARAARGDRHDRARPRPPRLRARAAHDFRRDLASLLIVEDVRYRPALVVGDRAGRRSPARRLPADIVAATLRGSRRCARAICSAMHRLFVAIRPPEHIRDLLIDAMDDSPEFRWQDEEQLHLTLRFVGEVERPSRRRSRRRAQAGPRRAFRAPHRRRRPLRAAQSAAHYGPASNRRSPLAALAAKVERVCQSSRPRARAPRLPSAHHACPLERPPHARSAELSRTQGAGLVRAVRSRRLHPVRKPPLPPRRALEEVGWLPARG